MVEVTELQNRQSRLKVIVRCISVIDLMHMAFPITCFSNLSVFALLLLFGKHHNKSETKYLLTLAPIGMVGIIAHVYGVMVVLRLFNATHPEVRPFQSANMALWWCHYSIVLIVIQLVGAAVFVFLGVQNNFVVGEIFSFAIIFSVATRLVCLYMVRKMVIVLRKKEAHVNTDDFNLRRKTTIKWQLPLPSLPSSEESFSTPLQLAKKQNELQMIFLTQFLAVTDLMQNTFMVLALIFVSIAFAAKVDQISSTYYTPVGVGGLVSQIIFCLLMFFLFSYGIYSGRQLLSSTDKFSGSRQLQAMTEEGRFNISAVVRNWLIGSFLCLLLLEAMCLTRIIVYGDIPAMIYSCGLSLSFSIRGVSLYFINIYRETFFKGIVRTRKTNKVESIKVPPDIETPVCERDNGEACDMTAIVKSFHEPATYHVDVERVDDENDQFIRVHEEKKNSL